MPTPANCPSCDSDDINYSAKHGDWVCADCAHRFDAPPSEAVPVPPDATDDPLAPAVAAFISYGHADGSDFASRLKVELETRGVSPIWLDSEMIATGDDFWAAMQAGIAGSDVLLAVMTPSSLREGSVCWREMAFADDRGKRIVPVRIDADPALRPNVLLVGRSWADFTSSPWSDAVERLLRGLSGEDAALRSVGVIGGIAPLRFAEEVSRHLRRFSGREWLDAELDEWLRSDTGRAFVIVGEPGIGKSAIAAHLTTRDDVVAWHFCTARGYDRSLNPQEFVASVVSALSQRLPAFADALSSRHPELPREDAGSAFRELVVEPAQAIESPPAPQLLIVDALDEAAIRTGEGGTIVDLIAAHASSLPAWLRIVATSRPEAAVISKLKALHPIELAADRAENLDDVAVYLAARLTGVEAVPEGEREGVARALADKAAGNFLWATMAADALEQGVFSADEVSGIPTGLDAFYSLAFARAFPDPEAFLRDYAPVLRPLAAAFAPVPTDVLEKATSLDASSLNLRLSRLRSYLKVQGAGSDAAYSLFHPSLSEWLAGRDASAEYWCDTRAGHEQMAAALGEDPLGSEYSTRWVPRHLMALERWEELRCVLADVRYLCALRHFDGGTAYLVWLRLEDRGLSMSQTYEYPCSHPEEFSARSIKELGFALWDQAHLEEARTLFTAVLVYGETIGDFDEVQTALIALSGIVQAQGDSTAALEIAMRKLRIADAQGDAYGAASARVVAACMLRHLGRGEEALALAEPARTCPGWPAIGAHELSAAIYSSSGAFPDALRESDAAIEAAERMGEEKHVLGALQAKAEVLLQQSRAKGVARDEAALLLERCASGYELAGLLKESRGCFHSLALVRRDLGDLEGAQSALERELSLLPHDAQVKRAGVFAEQGRILTDAGKYEEAIERMRSAREVFVRAGDRLGEALAVHGEAFARRRAGDLGEALSLFEQELHLLDSLSRPPEYRLTQCLMPLGWLLMKMGRADDGLRVLQREVPLLRQAGNDSALAGCLYNLGSALHKTGDWLGAAERYGEAAHLFGECGNREDELGALFWRAKCLDEVGELAEALAAWQRHYEAAVDTGDVKARRHSLREQSVICLKLGLCTEALERIDAALTLRSETADPSGYQWCLGQRAQVMADLGQFGEAAEALSQKERICRETDHPTGLVWALAGRAYLAARQGVGPPAVVDLVRRAYEFAVERGLAEQGRDVLMTGPLEAIERAGMAAYVEPLRALRDELLPPESPDA